MKKLNFIYQKKLGYLFLSPAIIFILGLFSEIIFASGFMKFVSDLDLIFITSFLTTTSFKIYIGVFRLAKKGRLLLFSSIGHTSNFFFYSYKDKLTDILLVKIFIVI